MSTFLTAVVALTGASALVLVEAEAEPLRDPPAQASKLQFENQQPILVDLGPDGRLYLPVEANGHPISFMVDTGASHTLIDPAMARSIGVDITGNTQLSTVGGVIEAATGEMDSLRTDTITIRDLRVIVVDDLSVPVLGMDVLRRADGLTIRTPG